MMQSERLERYKQNPCPSNSLHAFYDWTTGMEYRQSDSESHVPSYAATQHLQLDAIALFLNYLGQMIASGLEIVFSTAEVSFVQNLIYYIERAYRTPDFGRWGRGTRHNCGATELSASSVGAVKSSLSALNGLNLFGKHGTSWGRVRKP